jgi:hypothetical protein
MPFARISITLPRDVLAAADRRARALDRSRSWLISDAIRAYVPGSPSPVHVPATPPSGVASPGLGPQRLAQLESDLGLTPEQRIRAAQETARLGERVRRTGGRAHRVLAFERYEDYVDWKRTADASP